MDDKISVYLSEYQRFTTLYADEDMRAKLSNQTRTNNN
jgi:hypothetical protein